MRLDFSKEEINEVMQDQLKAWKSSTEASQKK
jgi:hypothetical protein